MKHSVLIVDDSPSIRENIRATLKKEGMFEEYLEAPNGVVGFKLLVEKEVDIVLCDLMMPELDGFKFLELKKSKPELSDVPVIMLTAESESHKKVMGLEKGASDYIVKPFHEGELLARVKVHLQIKSLQDELRTANSMLKQLSITDALTGIYNRRYFMENLEREFNRCKRYKDLFSVVLMDIDHFKVINDSYGHLFGDFVLKEVCAIALETLRSTDILARFGGEEFILLLPGTDSSGAVAMAERIRYLIEKNTFVQGSQSAKLTLSAGVASFPHEKSDSAEAIMKLADHALYSAKSKGRNRVVIHSVL